MASILVVDDEADIGATIEAMLAGSGHVVRCESEPERVLMALSEDTFDLIISDIFMPVFDGIELILKVNQISPSTRVLAMTGGSKYFPSGSEALGDITSSAELFGASGVLRKPFRRKDLLAAVDAIIRS